EDGIRDRTVTGVQTCALPIFFFIMERAVWQFRKQIHHQIDGSHKTRMVRQLTHGLMAHAAAEMYIENASSNISQNKRCDRPLDHRGLILKLGKRSVMITLNCGFVI